MKSLLTCQGNLFSCRSLPDHIARGTENRVLGLKEWAVNVKALKEGDQTILLRKGGIREPAFKVQAEEFFLIPNSFHSDVDLLKPASQQKYCKVLEENVNYKEQKELVLDTWVKVTGVWTTSKIETLSNLDKFHIWNEAYLQNRLSWRAKQPITILELQCHSLEQSTSVDNEAGIWGCFSFAELPTLPDRCLEKLEPVLSQEVFWEKQKALRAELCRSEVHVVFS